jgi:TRAP-type transport system small permease protein
LIEKLEYQIGKISDSLNQMCKVLLGMIVGAMFSIIFVQVILRYAFNNGFSWAEEVTIFLMAWMTFIGSAIAVKQAAHINIDMFVDKLPVKAKWVVIIISKLVVLLFIVVFTYFGFQFAMGSATFQSNVLRIPLVWPRISITVSGIIIIIHLLHSLLKDIKELKER